MQEETNYIVDKVNLIRYVEKERYGSVSDLLGRIGDKNFRYLLESGIIYQGKNHPELWRITDKGIRRSKALSSRFIRILTKILWNLGILS